MSEYNQCRGQISQLYERYSQNAQFCENRLEFTEYELLYFAVTKNQTQVTQTLTKSFNTFKNNERIQKIKRIVVALKTAHYVRFFQTFDDMPKLGQRLLDHIIPSFRFISLRNILNVLCPFFIFFFSFFFFWWF